MRLTIERADLLKSLQHVQSVVERRNTIPILSNLMVSAQSGRLCLTATDMDIAVVDAVPSDIGQDGATTAPAHMLYDIVRKLPEGSEVEIATEDGNDRLSVRTGRSSFSLHCLPTEDFPVMTDGEFSHQFTMPAGELLRLVDKTRFAISTEETRYYLNGIYLHAIDGPDGKMLRAVATDGTAEPEPHLWRRGRLGSGELRRRQHSRRRLLLVVLQLRGDGVELRGRQSVHGRGQLRRCRRLPGGYAARL